LYNNSVVRFNALLRGSIQQMKIDCKANLF